MASYCICIQMCHDVILSKCTCPRHLCTSKHNLPPGAPKSKHNLPPGAPLRDLLRQLPDAGLVACRRQEASVKKNPSLGIKLSSTSPVPKTLMSTYTACKYNSYHNLVLPVCFLAALYWKLKYGFEGLASQQVLVYDRAYIVSYVWTMSMPNCPV